MNSNTRVHRSGVMLLEVLIAILLISVCSVVCLQVFAKASQTSRQAQLLTQAVNACTSAAEVFRAADSPEKALALLGQSSCEGFCFAIEQQAGCILKIHISEKRSPVSIKLEYESEKGERIYQLELTKYYPEVIS